MSTEKNQNKALNKTDVICSACGAVNSIRWEKKSIQNLQLQQTGVSGCFLEDVTDDVFNMGYKQVSCCKIAPITDENYCPKCGKKILK